MENNNDPARGYAYKAQQARGAPEQASRVKRDNPMICRYIDEEVVGNGTGLFQIGGHWQKVLPQNSKGAS